MKFSGRSKLLVCTCIGLLLGVWVGDFLAFQRISSLENMLNERSVQLTDFQKQIAEKNSQILRLEKEIIELRNSLDVEILGVFFSPNGGCLDQVQFWIDKANESIYILIYSFTLDSIGNALVNAYERGVEIQVVFEEGQITQYSEYEKLKSTGVSARIDSNPKLMHNKIMIVDEKTVLTGSFNWSSNGENYNNENLIVINSTYIANIYRNEFTKIWNKSQG